MRSVLWRMSVLSMCVGTLCLSDSALGSDDKQPAVTILSPAATSHVERLTNVVLETTQPGYPVLFVSPHEDLLEWWVQPLVRSAKPGRYTIPAFFGNAATPPGKAFQVIALLAPTERAAEALAKQQVFSQLPKTLPMSRPVVVMRSGVPAVTTVTTVTTAGTAVIAQIASPTSRSRVTRLQPITGVLLGALDPVILVRSAEPNSPWWVQERVTRNAAGEFTVVARFGNERTPAGTEFQMVVLTPRSAAEAANYVIGESVSELPVDAVVSAPLVLVLEEKQDAGGAE